jgi:hypothetical protein
MSWAVKIFAEGSSLSPSHEKLPNADNIKVKIKTSRDRHVSLEMLNVRFACIGLNKYICVAKSAN